MQKSTSSPLLVAVILILTFPIWFGVGAGLFGVIIGIFGAVIGIIGALLGVLVGLIVLPFKLLFGWDNWGWHSDFDGGFFHTNNWFIIILLIIIAILVVQKRKPA